MKRYLMLQLAVLAILFHGCANGQIGQGETATKTSLSANEFAAKMKELPNAPLVDVRTPDEFAKGHLQNAKNIDWNGSDFAAQTAALDKSKPVLVYCLSGGRSAAAISSMLADGFLQVYELSGGIMKWRGAGLPESTENTAVPQGMTKAQFEALLDSDKLVLIDFYAEWCAPCKKMEPYLKEISTEMADKVTVIRIDADNNQQLCIDMHIDALPVLQLYKNKALAWENLGFIEKAEVVKQLK